MLEISLVVNNSIICLKPDCLFKRLCLKEKIQSVDSKNMYKTLMVFLGVFTLLDIFITRLGLSLGFVELNAFVNKLGLDAWSIFRLLLLGYLCIVYYVGYKLFLSHSEKGFWMLKNSLYALNIAIGAIVFSGIFHLIPKLIV